MNRGYRGIENNHTMLYCAHCEEKLPVENFAIVEKKTGLYYDSWCCSCRLDYKRKPKRKQEMIVDYDIPAETKEKWQFAKKNGLLIYPVSMEKNG